MNNVAAIILAAGKGKRMHASTRNKVVYPIAEKPIVSYTIDHIRLAGINTIVVVVGFQAQSVKDAIGSDVIYAFQKQRLGTGHAVKTGLAQLPPSIDTVISMYGDDSAFYPPSLFTQLLASHASAQAAVSLVTIHKPNPEGLGRIIRNQADQVTEIVEEKNASAAQKKITEINTGLYCFNRQFLDSYLPRIKRNVISKEYYLTDLIALAVKTHLVLNAVCWPQNDIWQGVNTPSELVLADTRMRQSLS